MDTTIKIFIEENTSKLQAVKLIKAITKKGLKEAKEDFDAFLKENGMNTSWFKPGKKAVFEINYKVINGDFDHIDNVIKDYEIWK